MNAATVKNAAPVLEQGRALEELSFKVEYPAAGLSHLKESFDVLSEQKTALHGRSREFYLELAKLPPVWQARGPNGGGADEYYEALQLASGGMGASVEIHAFWKRAVDRYAKEVALHISGQPAADAELTAAEENLKLAREGLMIAHYLRLEWSCARSQIEMRCDGSPTPGSRLNEVFDQAGCLLHAGGFDPVSARERLAEVYDEVVQYHGAGKKHENHHWREFARKRAAALRARDRR